MLGRLAPELPNLDCVARVVDTDLDEKHLTRMCVCRSWPTKKGSPFAVRCLTNSARGRMGMATVLAPRRPCRRAARLVAYRFWSRAKSGRPIPLSSGGSRGSPRHRYHL